MCAIREIKCQNISLGNLKRWFLCSVLSNIFWLTEINSNNISVLGRGRSAICRQWEHTVCFLDICSLLRIYAYKARFWWQVSQDHKQNHQRNWWNLYWIHCHVLNQLGKQTQFLFWQFVVTENIKDTLLFKIKFI